MLKKLTCALLALALLVPCLIAASAAAAPNYLIPFMFYSTYNDALQTVLDSGLPNASSSEKQQYVDDLKISFTENIDSIMYYNNADWTLETSFYFAEGTPSYGGTASTLNFVINVTDSDARAIAQDAFVLAMSKLDSGINRDALSTWARSNPDLNNGFDLGDYQIILVPADTYLHYAVLSRDASASDAGTQSGGSTQQGSTSLPITLASYNGYVVTLKSLSLNEYGGDYVSLRFNISVANSSGYKINLFVDDTVLNGISCKMWGSMYSDENPKDYDDFIFIDSEVDSNYDSTLAAALRNARTISFTLRAQDDENYKVIFTQPVSLDLSQLPISVN